MKKSKRMKIKFILFQFQFLDYSSKKRAKIITPHIILLFLNTIQVFIAQYYTVPILIIVLNPLQIIHRSDSHFPFKLQYDSPSPFFQTHPYPISPRLTFQLKGAAPLEPRYLAESMDGSRHQSLISLSLSLSLVGVSPRRVAQITRVPERRERERERVSMGEKRRGPRGWCTVGRFIYDVISEEFSSRNPRGGNLVARPCWPLAGPM